MDRLTVRLIITGRVQGVGYRWWAQDQARALGLDGWVRNRRDGSVELVTAGQPGAIDRLVEICRHGPPAAMVEAVQRFEAEDEGFDGFQERPTV